MSLGSPLEAGALWDEWCVARATEPGLSAEEFVARFGDLGAEALDLLETQLAVEEEAPLPSLVRVLQPGEDGVLRFAGFTLLRELGEGAAGIVYEAIDERSGGSGERVALKLLNPTLGSGRHQRDVILREARITQRLEHPGIVRVLGSGIEKGYAWIATELVEGESLEEWIDVECPFAERIARTLEVGLQIASALAHAHERGVLHRDLKPANVMRGEDGAVKVLDFGLARREGAAFGMSRTGEVVGTPLYMAPEQLRGETDLDGRVDLYALGLVMLELATGKRLQVREGALRTLARIARGRGRFPGRFFAGLPGDLVGVLSRCLEPDPRDRYPEANTLIEDLEALREGRRPRLRRLGPLVRLGYGIVRRPMRALGVAVIIGAAVWVGTWVAGHLPIAVTVDSLMARPVEVRVDGEEVSASLPLSLSLWRRGAHAIEFSDGTYRYPFEIDVRDGGARSFFLPFGRVYRPQRPVGALPGGWAGERVGFLQVGVRPADRSDHHGSFPVNLRVPGLIDLRAPGVSTFPLEVLEQPHYLHIESDGFRPRDIPITVTDGRTRSVMVELDPVDSPWHTILVSSPLDPAVEAGLVRMENLALRWETSERDGYSDGLVHRVGLGVVDPGREGVLHFKIPLPVEVEEIQLLGIADPEIFGKHVDPELGICLEMGPGEGNLIPMFNLGFPGVEPPIHRFESDATARLNRALSESRGRELHVRYRAVGESAWILRTNALPRRKENRSIHWDPAIRLRVRGPGSEMDARGPFVSEMPTFHPPARRTVDLATAKGIFAFDGGPPGELVNFNLAGGMDADGDGTNDFALRIHDRPEHVEIRSGANGSVLLELDGEPGDDFGRALAFVPDLDGDGGADLLVGAPQRAGTAGEGGGGDLTGYVSLFSSRTGAILGRADGALLREGFGDNLDFIGDLDGEGQFSAITSTLEYKAGGWGSAKVLSLPELRVLHHFIGREQCDHFGNDCCGVGDVNADGIPDFVVASFNEDAPFWDSGAVNVHSGDAAAGFPLIHRIVGEQAWDWLGKCVAPAGDPDADGHADFLVLSDRNPPMSRVLLISGKTGKALRGFTGLPGDVLKDSLLVCDLDLDGHGDIAVHGRRAVIPEGAREGERHSFDYGLVFSAVTGEPLLEIRGVPGGCSPLLAPASDIDGDGREELLVGLGRPEGAGRARMLFLLSGE